MSRDDDFWVLKAFPKIIISRENEKEDKNKICSSASRYPFIGFSLLIRFLRLFLILPFVHSFIHSFTHYLSPSFTDSFIHSFIHSFYILLHLLSHNVSLFTSHFYFNCFSQQLSLLNDSSYLLMSVILSFRKKKFFTCSCWLSLWLNDINQWY